MIGAGIRPKTVHCGLQRSFRISNRSKQLAIALDITIGGKERLPQTPTKMKLKANKLYLFLKS
ncbi:hypothetical protein LguiA_013047 [Lonicera macranthoides]